RLAEIGRALAQLVEQPSILDGDDGLVSKVRDKLDLLVGESLSLLAIDIDSADQAVLLEHRDHENRASACEVRQGEKHWVAFEVRPPRPNILDVGNLPCPLDVAETAFRVGTERPGPRFNVSGGALWNATVRKLPPS